MISIDEMSLYLVWFQRLYKARQKLDGMRASLVATYYSTVTQAALQVDPTYVISGYSNVLHSFTQIFHFKIFQHLILAAIAFLHDIHFQFFISQYIRILYLVQKGEVYVDAA